MDPHDVRDLRRAVLKHRRISASVNKDFSPSSNIPRAEASGGDSVPRISPKVCYPPKSKSGPSFG